MTVRWFLVFFFLIGGIRAEKPNVLFIAVDDLRPEILKFGAEYSVTPYIDRLCEQGVRFERAYCMVPTCGASRASLMTSVRPTRDRFKSFNSYASKDAPSAKPIHTHFKEQGYYTVSLGKVFHGKGDHEDGWSEKPWRSDVKAYVTKEAIEQLEKDAKGRMRGPATESANVEDVVYRDGQIAKRAVEQMEKLAKRNQPFFLAVGFTKPHLPFNAPTRYWELYDKKTVKMPDNFYIPKGAPSISIHASGELRNYSDIPKKGPISEETALNLIHGYHACVSYVDVLIGQVLDQLDALRLKDNTVVVLWGDHGWNLGEHTLWCKHSCYETSLHAPLIISVPGMKEIKKGRAARQLTEFIDIYPTLCELAGVRIPDHVEGKSLLPVLLNPEAVHKPFAISRFGEGDTIRTHRYRYSLYRDRNGKVIGRMLYDHKVDPAENKNIAVNPEHALLVKRLETQLLANMGKIEN